MIKNLRMHVNLLVRIKPKVSLDAPFSNTYPFVGKGLFIHYLLSEPTR